MVSPSSTRGVIAMADPKGFITLHRATPERQAVAERVRHWGEFYQPVPDASVRTQASRCMDCGVRFGHGVVVFEKSERVGGLLRFGIPEFKLEKSVLDSRLDQLEGEGVQFRTGIDIGEDLTVEELRAEFDAICIAIGAGMPRDLEVPARDLTGIHFPMDFLKAQNR